VKLIITSKEEIIQLVRDDAWMMEVLRAVQTLNLPDWWVCAGFVRSKIWDVLHGFEDRTPIPDIDVIYFDPSNILEDEEKKLEAKLRDRNPSLPWSVKNEAIMHAFNNISPYTSSVDAISKFPETATALGLRLDENNNIVLTAPCGIEDVLNLIVKPTPHFEESKELAHIYEERILKKNWKSTWGRITIFHIQNTL
jgi:hypothetical protein